MRWLALALSLAALAYAATGIYTVGPDQRALVRRFGKVVLEESAPGLHMGLPWGLDRVDLVKPSETKTVDVGVGGPADQPLQATAPGTLAQFLTGDQNLVNVKATVQYTIRDPKQHLFGSADPSRAIARATEAAITGTLADQPIDTVLTTGKNTLAILIKDRLQSRLDAYSLGVEVRSVNLTELSPPPQVADAFTRAASARSDRERLILEAQRYANDKLAQAQSESQQSLDKARAAHDRSIDLTHSEAERFEKLLSEYTKDRLLTATRLYLETMAEIIPRFRSKVIIDSGNGVDVTIMREEP
jgi:membrane protease subunit HflK